MVAMETPRRRPHLPILLVLILLTLLVAMVTAVPSRQNPKAALLIVDIQDCFLAGGSLAVDDANDVIPVVNRIHEQVRHKTSVVVFSQDWHPRGHVSFASSHPGMNVLEAVELTYLPNGSLCIPANDPTFASRFPLAVPCNGLDPNKTLHQTLWPDHCIQNVTTGPTSSKLADSLWVDPGDVLIRKGTIKKLDSYSAFYDNGHFGHTDLHRILQANDVTHLFIMGIATDYCVYFSSLDALKLGYETFVVMDASKGVAQETTQRALADLRSKGAHLITSNDIEQQFDVFTHDAGASTTLSMVAMVTNLVLSVIVARGMAWL